MKKKILTGIYVVLIVVAVFVIQLFVINPRSLFGIKPNLILITTIVISLWYGVYTGGISAIILGIIADTLFGSSHGGVFTISYTIVGVVIGVFNYNYRKENKMSLVYVTIIATFLFEVVQCIFYLISGTLELNLIYLLKQIIISSLLNIVIVYIVYSIIYRLSEYIEDRIIQSKRGF